MSNIGWIDFSPQDKSRVKSALALIKEKGTLDELGIGQFRDAFSDLLFPGISTIQTRAKYFIIVPRILRDYQKLDAKARRKAKSLNDYLETQENLVAKVLHENALIEESKTGKSVLGIIGRSRINDGGVARRPSEIYWNGLRILGLVDTRLSRMDFCRQQDKVAIEHREVNDKAEGSDDIQESYSNILLPSFDADWLSEKVLTIELTRKEAQLLSDRLVESQEIKHCVLSQTILHDLSDTVLSESQKVDALSDDNKHAISFDRLAQTLQAQSKLSERCKDNLRIALQFSLAIEGPHLRYNIVLARKFGFDESAKKYEYKYSTWLENIESLNVLPLHCEQEWLAKVVEAGSSVNNKSQNFIINFFRSVREGASLVTLDKMVEDQALLNKGHRSLLKKKHIEDQWYGMRRLDYRWGTAKVILQDIQRGLYA